MFGGFVLAQDPRNIKNLCIEQNVYDDRPQQASGKQVKESE
jgi:hypothetical protein